MEHPPTVFWDNTFGKIGRRGFKIAAQSSSSLEIPTVNVDLASDTFEVECQGFQDRPPHESFNHVSAPFLPWSWPSSEDPEESRLAFVMSQDYQSWSERLRFHQKQKNFGETSLRYPL